VINASSMEKTNEATEKWTVRMGNNILKPCHIECDGRYILSVERKEDADKIVKAVNAYDSLVEEVQKLKEQYKILHDNSQEDIGNLMAENQKLRELLEKIKDSRELRFAKLRGELYHPLELEIASILTKAKNV
jgi:hypothetical protein